jgi:hypothetical protein
MRTCEAIELGTTAVWLLIAVRPRLTGMEEGRGRVTVTRWTMDGSMFPIEAIFLKFLMHQPFLNHRSALTHYHSDQIVNLRLPASRPYP